MISRRAFIQTLAGIAALGASPARASAALNFLVFGDWGMADSKILPRVAEQMSIAAEQTDSQFVITTGDNFYPNGVASLDDPLWQLLQTNFTTDELKRPWYPALGNHDWRGNVEAQIAYTEVDPRWRMPGRFFSHIEPPVSESDKAEFFHIDTTPLAEPELLRGARDDQLDWLDRALTASTEKWKIVVGHHPVYSGGRHGDTPVLIERLVPILKSHGVRIYLNGHDHDLQHIEREGVHYITCGAAGQPQRTSATTGTLFCASNPGFSTVSLSPSDFQFRFIGIEGLPLYEASIPLLT